MQAKLIAEQEKHIQTEMDSLMECFTQQQYQLLVSKLYELNDTLKDCGINLSPSFISDITDTSGLLAKISSNTYRESFSEKNELILSDPQNGLPLYLIKKGYSDFWLYECISETNSKKPLIHIEKKPEDINSQLKLIIVVEKQLSNLLLNIIDDISLKITRHRIELRDQQEELERLRRLYSKPREKIKKFLIALLLYPVRFALSERYVREHPIFHFTFPPI